MRWVWDPRKGRTNERKHGLNFEAAEYVFDDPLSVSRRDPYPHEERWQTIGLVRRVVLVVIHTWPDEADRYQVGRIISARRATPRERRAYEEGAF